MDERRLDMIEHEIGYANSEFDLPSVIDMARELIAEVRRLQRALHLSELSRGVPSGAAPTDA